MSQARAARLPFWRRCWNARMRQRSLQYTRAGLAVTKEVRHEPLAHVRSSSFLSFCRGGLLVRPRSWTPQYDEGL